MLDQIRMEVVFISIMNRYVPSSKKGSVYILTLILITVLSLFVMVFVQKVHYETIKSREQINRFKASKVAQLAFNKAIYTTMTSYNGDVGSENDNFVTRPDISGWTQVETDKRYEYGDSFLGYVAVCNVSFRDMNYNLKKIKDANKEFIIQIDTSYTIDGKAYLERIEAKCITTTKNSEGFEAIRLNDFKYDYEDP